MTPCPNCGQTLTQRKSEHGILWDCEGCRRWLVGLPILRKSVESQFFNRLWQAVRNSGEGQGIACPTCSKAMNEIVLGTAEAPLSPLVCKWCNVAWLTVEQRAALPLPPAPEHAQAQAESAVEKKLPPEAAKLLALHKVELIAENARRENQFDASHLPLWQKVLALLGFPIQEDEGGAFKFPWATGLLVLTTMAASIYFFTDPEAFNRFGFIPQECDREGGLTFLSSFFVHGGWVHLLGNMYFLFVFGRMVEERVGWLLYLTLIIFATVSGNLMTLFFDPAGDIPHVGASGGIAGVLLFYGFTFPQKKIVFFIGGTYGFMRPRLVRVPAWVALGLWVLLQVFGASLQTSGVATVSYSSHLGGLMAGLIFWLMWKWLNSSGFIKVEG